MARLGARASAMSITSLEPAIDGHSCRISLLYEMSALRHLHLGSNIAILQRLHQLTEECVVQGDRVL